MRTKTIAAILLVCLSTAGGVAATAAPQRVAVLSYNIHHGEGMDGRIDLERIAGVIRSVSPDLVAVQEVDRKTRRSGGVDQAAELARLAGMTMVFGRTIDYQGGQYGNAVLSRLPIKGHKVQPLPYTKGREPRVVLAVEIAVSTGSEQVAFVFHATHLDHTRDPTDRLAAARAIVKLVEADKDVPALLAGDLNATPESPPLERLKALWTIAGAGRNLPTVPVADPKRQIDFVLYRPADRWRVVRARVLGESVASDHRPILAVLELLPEGSPGAL